MTRIAFIGAGSVEFTKNLLGDLLTFPELADATIALHDIDAERLDTAAAMARWTSGALGRGRDDRGAPRPARGDRGLRPRHQHDSGRRARGHAARLRDPEAVRAAPDDRRHARDRRHLPRPPHHPGDARHRGRHGRALPGRVAAQLHEPDGHAVLGDLRRLADPAGRRAVPLGAVDDARPGRDRRRAVRGGRVPRRGREPPGLDPPVPPPGPRPLPAARRGHRGRPGAAAAGARRDVPPARVLPHRVERALGRVPAVVHAKRRDDRAVPGARRRVRAPERGEPARVRGDAADAGGRSGRSRSSAASSTPR